MSKHTKTRAEIASSFYVNKSEICRMFGCGRIMSDKIFRSAQKIDIEELMHSYIDWNKVRMSSVLKVLGITDKEVKEKIKASPD